ncbi:hypothetical protein PILCRDRAFT_830194 [Piloderma croceum F 1598]|uniref:Uncharacterized protein n=1 Tax=Piloderma croceum (strain F 1598) TaxID=765440 RepID=A0A0C3EGC6_PILCF|nr:hypothetical protein PILCRDRAFT_830194 [Piloderma croceum F 1598]
MGRWEAWGVVSISCQSTRRGLARTNHHNPIINDTIATNLSRAFTSEGLNCQGSMEAPTKAEDS